MYVCNNAVADCSQLPGLILGCVLCWCTWGLAEAVAGVRGVIVPGCGYDPVYNRFVACLQSASVPGGGIYVDIVSGGLLPGDTSIV